MSRIWLGKSTPVAYSVNKPTNTPNITQRPLPISFDSVQPNTLRDARKAAAAAADREVQASGIALQVVGKHPALADRHTRPLPLPLESGKDRLESLHVLCQASWVVAMLRKSCTQVGSVQASEFVAPSFQCAANVCTTDRADQHNSLALLGRCFQLLVLEVLANLLGSLALPLDGHTITARVDTDMGHIRWCACNPALVCG